MALDTQAIIDQIKEASILELNDLAHEGDAGISVQPDRTLVRFYLTHQDAKQTCLPASVRSQKRDFIRGAEREGHIGKQRSVIGQREFGGFDKRAIFILFGVFR